MCDTMVATPDATSDGIMLFAKNSDREPNEAQYPEIIPAATHPEGSSLKCTYIEIPQAARTNRVLLSRPFWIWGAEMGSNEHGLTIGNEAVFTREPRSKTPALIGMDLIRLALERCANSGGAIDLIIKLIDTYGQGGNCGFTHEMHYHNSFIICDPREAWVLETAGRKWAAKRIRGVYAISNGLTIGNDWDRACPQLIDEKRRKGEGFSFSRACSDRIYTTFSDSRRRRARAMELLSVSPPDPARMMEILRDHYDEEIDKKITGASICNHAGFGPVRVSQTAGSMVSVLRPDLPLHFITAGAAPCTGVFKPIWLDCSLTDIGSPEGTADSESWFWAHERLHRTALVHGVGYEQERNRLESDLMSKALSLGKDDDRDGFSQKAFSLTRAAEKTWLQDSLKRPKKRSGILYSLAWRKFNRLAELEL